MGIAMITETLTKITDKTEIISQISRFVTYDLLVKFRENCLNKYSDIAVPSFGKNEMDKRLGLLQDYAGQDYAERMHLLKLYTGIRGGTDDTTIDCVVKFLRYPRWMKRALASVWVAWQQLHGEIYFDDLLVLHVIKNSPCELFHFIVSQRDSFRIYADSNAKNNNKGLYDEVENILNAAHVSVPERVPYHKLIQFLFPGWEIRNESNAKKMPSYLSSQVHTQGIASGGEIDYFSRATAEVMEENEPRDQDVMRFLQKYNDDKSSASDIMKEMMVSERLVERVEVFGRLLKPAKVLELTSEYFANVQENKLRGNFGNLGITGNLWRMSLDNYESKENHKSWLGSQIDKYLSQSLRFTNDIFYLWRSRTRDESKSSLYSGDLYGIYVEKVKQLMGDSQGFTKVLERDAPFIWAIRHVVFQSAGNDDIKRSTDDIFGLWKPWLVNLLEDAVKINPTVVAMCTVPLVYNLKDMTYDKGISDDDTDLGVTHGWSGEYDEEIATKLFGDDLPKIMKVISALKEDDYKGYSEIDVQAKAILDFAVIHSKQWLLDHPITQE
jgi:hypothetical protein